MKQRDSDKSRIQYQVEKFLSLGYFIQLFLISMAIFSDFLGTNKKFCVFLISFILTSVNFQRLFGNILSLPLALLHFLGFQLIGLLVAPWVTPILSVDDFNLIILVIPFFVTLMIKTNHRYTKHADLKISTVVDLFVTLLPTIVALGLLLKTISKYPNGWSFWALGGDSRNFLIHSINSVKSNGLTESLLANGPVFPSSLVGLLTPNFPQESNLQFYFQTIALFEFFCLALSSILIAIFARQLLAHHSIRNPIAVLISSAVPFSGLFAGVLQRDGFLGVATLLPIFLSLLILLVEILDQGASRKTRLYAYFSGSLILPILLLLTWTPFLIFAIIYVYYGYHALELKIFQYKKTFAILILINLLLFYYCLNPFMHFISANSQLTARGAITPPSLLIFLLVLMYFIYNIKTKNIDDAKGDVMKGMLIFFSLGGLVNIFLVGIQPFEAKWNYYPSKYGWVWLVASFPLVISTFSMNFSNIVRRIDLLKVFRSVSKKQRDRIESSRIFVVTFSLILFYLIQPPVPSPWIQPWFNAMAKGQFGAYSQVLNGWAAPSPEAITRIYSIKESERQPMFFKYFANPSDDRMSNFLLVLYSLNSDGSRKPIADKLSSYAYFANPTDVKSICDLVDGSQSELKILTKSESFESDFDSVCKLDSQELEVLLED